MENGQIGSDSCGLVRTTSDSDRAPDPSSEAIRGSLELAPRVGSDRLGFVTRRKRRTPRGVFSFGRASGAPFFRGYARRWTPELCLRDLKTTLGMEMLRCKTPAMARKEILMYFLAHNLIRCLMADAVARHQVDLQGVSFKGTVDAFRQYTAAVSAARNKKIRDQLWLDLLANLVRDTVPLRPGRQEPKALKQR